MTERRSGRADLVTVFAAGAVSMLGSAVSFVAIPWYVFSSTGSAAKTGLVSAVAGVGTVLSGLVSGPLMDRAGRRRVGVAADLLAAAAIACVALFGRGSLWIVAALVFVSSAAAMASGTARQSMLPALSAAAGTPLSRTSAIYWMLQRTALAAAALPVGLLILAFGPLDILWVDAATFLVAATLIGLRRMPAAVLHQTATRPGFRDGWRFMRGDPLIGLVLATAILLSALEAPLVTVVFPVLSSASGPQSLSLLVLAYSAGMLAGGAALAVIADRVPRRATAVCCLSLTGAGYVALVTLVPLPSSPSPSPWSVVVLAVMGCAAGPLAPLIVTSVQRRTPAAMVAHVTGTLMALVLAAVPVGRAVAGYAVQAAGLEAVLIASALAYLATMAFLALSKRSAALLATSDGSEA
jgi:predicted MFS family arabinose efflux permease